MSRTAQLSLFAIIGLVLVLSVGFILYLVISNAPTAPTAQIDEDVTLARTCLAQATRAAIAALGDDSLITEGEFGRIPVPNKPQPFISEGDYITNYRGRNTFIGLCARNGENARVNGRYLCQPFAYHYAANPPSMQDMIREAISGEMSQCVGDVATPQVQVQPDALYVTWPQPQIDHTEFTALHEINAWIAREISHELTDWSYDLHNELLSNTDFGVSEIGVKSPSQPYREYEVKASNDDFAQPVLTFTIENRKPLYWDGTRYFAGDQMSTNDEYACEGSYIDGDFCLIPVYSIDNDDLSLTAQPPWIMDPNDLATYSNTIQNPPLVQAPNQAVLELIVMPEESAPTSKYYIKFSPSCDNVGNLARPYTVRVTDDAGAWTDIRIRASDPRGGCQQ